MFNVSLVDVPPDASARGQSTLRLPDLICVCCNCDRVRSRSGKWAGDHTPLPGERRTHGICPECFVVLYPEFTDLAAR